MSRTIFLRASAWPFRESDEDEVTTAKSLLMRHGVLTAALVLVSVAGCASNGEGFSLDAFVKGLLPSSSGDVLEESVLSADPDVRRKALYAMSKWKESDAELVTLVGITLLGEKDMMTRVQAARTLGAWADPEGLGYLSIALTGDSSDADMALGTEGGLTLPKVADRSKFVRGEAAKALGNIPEDGAVASLVAALRTDVDRDVRIRCVRALRHHRNVAAAKALILALADNCLAVRVTARESLEYMTGQDLGDDPAAWDAYVSGTDAPLADYGNRPTRKRATQSTWFHISEDRRTRIKEIFSDLFPLERKEGPFD